MFNLLPAFGLALAIGAPVPKEAPKKAETPSIVGEWECVELIGGGRVATPKELAQMGLGMKFTADGKCLFREGTPKGPNETESTYSTNPTQNPAQLDFRSSKSGKTVQRIYKIDKNMLTICAIEGVGERPTKFESPAGTRIMLLTFKRVEKKKE